jgi:arylsulfatase
MFNYKLYQMNKTSVVCSVSLLSAVFVSCDEKQKLPKQPNIIYILADDLGYADLGCYGQKKIETPNIDRLAAQGIRFLQNYSGSPVSAPTRCITLTGLHSGHSYIRGNDEMRSRGEVWDHAAMLANAYLEGQRPLPAGTITYPKLLQQAGYTTGCVGKWGLGYPGSEGAPNKMGFDFFYGYNCQRQAHTYYPPFLYRNEQREYLPNELLPPGAKLDEGADPYDEKSYTKFTQKVYSPDPMYAEILQFVENNKDRPFYLHWTTTLPHVALQAPERWVNYYHEKFGPEEPYLGQQGYFPCRYPHATYAAMISYLDEQVGGLIEKLKALGIYENTVIILTSDNGPASGSGTDARWFESAQPFTSEPGWIKASVREGGIRVPLIVSWEGVIKPNTQTNHISAAWDVMQTICDLAQIEAPPNDGISYLPTLLGQTNKQKEHAYLYWEFPEGGGAKTIRMGKWKGVILNIRQEGEANMMLFDIEADPKEQNNVASQNPGVIQILREKMAEAHEEPIVSSFAL